MEKTGSSFDDSITATPSPNFGDDILCEILCRIPTKSLMRLKLVCKRWRSIIKDPNFGTLHFSRLEPTLDDTILLIHPLGIRKEHAGESPILFSLDLFGGGTPVPMKVDLGRPLDQIHMLKPVKGLICFVQDTSVLIFNPCTGERTSWIEVTTSASVGKDEDGKIFYSFGFGFDETTKKHKVVCICEIFSKPRTNEISPPADHRVCEVLTVGDNTWRRIDKVPPPYNLRLDAESLYADGSIFWLDANVSRQVIVAFDVGSEEFRKIRLSGKIQEYWVRGMPLAEVYGRMAVLDSVGYACIKYWISPYDDDDDDDDDDVDDDDDDDDDDDVDYCYSSWSEYSIYDPPFFWDGEGYLAFEAITGTDLIILQSFNEPIELKSLHYFNCRKRENKFEKVEIAGMSQFPTPERGYEIRTFKECLLPVHNQQC